MLAFVLPSFARTCMAMKLGMAIAARMPMITTTIISSMSVNPFCACTCDFMSSSRVQGLEKCPLQHGHRLRCQSCNPDAVVTLASRDPPRSRRVLVALVDRIVVLGIATRTVLPGLLEAVTDELAVQRRGVDAQELARALLLPAREVQDLEDVLLLQLLERHVGRVDDQAPLLAVA